MTEDHHIMHYIFLILGFVVLCLLMLLFRYNIVMQNILIVATGLYYCTWGLVHHYLEGRINKLIALEYIAFSTFATVLVLTVLNL